MHLNPITSLLIVNTKIEGFLCIVLIGFWAATVAIVSDSNYDLAVDDGGAVSNGNLYYFSWAGFVTSITTFISYLRSALNVDVAGEMKSRSARLNIWAAHLAASLIVMGSSANLLDRYCESEDSYKGGEYCRRTVFGIVLGLLSTLFSFIIIGMKIATSKAPFLIEASSSFALLVSFGFAVAIITSQKGPGAPLGNLYYFTWIAFFTSFLLSASCTEDYNAARAMTEEETQARNSQEQARNDLDQI